MTALFVQIVSLNSTCYCGHPLLNVFLNDLKFEAAALTKSSQGCFEKRPWLEELHSKKELAVRATPEDWPLKR